MDFAPDGCLAAFDTEEVAQAMLWEGDPDQLWKGLVDSRFVDVENGPSRIHDWHDYAGRLVERREANAERMRQSRAARRAQPPGPRADDVQRTDDARGPDVQGLPDRTVPDLTGPDRTGPPSQTLPATEREGLSALPRADSGPGRTKGFHDDGRAPPNGTRRGKSVLDGRNGWHGCPRGCPTNHGGPAAVRHLGEDWLAIPESDRPPWPAFLASHGRPDFADQPAPTPATQEA
jgi:hypothetical protein